MDTLCLFEADFGKIFLTKANPLYSTIFASGKIEI